jgi:AraC-like DNA-binding protein
MPGDLVPLSTMTLDRLTPLGVDVSRVLARANVAPSRFEGGKARVTTAEFFAVWRAIEEIGPADIGLRLGSETPSHQQHVASLAALHSPNLGEGLRRLARYKRLVCPEDVRLDVTRGEARLRYEWVLAEDDPPSALIDGVFASAMQIARRGTGKSIAARRLDLARRSSNGPALRRYFGCDVRFDAPHDVLVFDAKTLDEPFVTHNPDLLQVLVPGLEMAIVEATKGDEKRGDARSLLADVRAALRRQIAGERPAVEKVAKALGLSGRTLQRRLVELGTTYQAQLDDVRRASARRLLAATDLDAGEVAFLLGFEELNSFSRAFHVWEGTTPTRWRARHGGAAKGAHS